MTERKRISWRARNALAAIAAKREMRARVMIKFFPVDFLRLRPTPMGGEVFVVTFDASIMNLGNEYKDYNPHLTKR